MSALVPYVASEVSPMAVELGKAVGAQLGTAALKGAKNLFAHKKSGRTKTRLSKKESFNMQQLGRKGRSAEAKRAAREQVPAATNNKELSAFDIIRVEKDVAANENISKRQRDTILHKGVKVCFTCKNIRKEVVFLNWAIVTPKAANAIDSTNILRGEAEERYLPVNNQQTTMDLRCAPINTDRYNVHMHKRYTIKPDSDKSANVKEGSDLVIIEKYIKTNRQLFFNGDQANPLTNMYMIYWVDYYGSPTGVNALTAECSWKFINYFHDI